MVSKTHIGNKIYLALTFFHPLLSSLPFFIVTQVPNHFVEMRISKHSFLKKELWVLKDDAISVVWWRAFQTEDPAWAKAWKGECCGVSQRIKRSSTVCIRGGGSRHDKTENLSSSWWAEGHHFEGDQSAESCVLRLFRQQCRLKRVEINQGRTHIIHISYQGASGIWISISLVQKPLTLSQKFPRAMNKHCITLVKDAKFGEVKGHL